MKDPDFPPRRPKSELGRFMDRVFADDVAEPYPILKPDGKGRASSLYTLFEDRGPKPHSPLNAQFKKNILIHR